MKCIWQKYKIWLLIGAFYAAYGAVKAFKMLKPKPKLSDCRDCR